VTNIAVYVFEYIDCFILPVPVSADFYKSLHCSQFLAKLILVEGTAHETVVPVAYFACSRSLAWYDLATKSRQAAR